MKKALSLLIVLTMIVSVFAISAISTPASGASQYSQSSTPVEGGNILHAMNWSYSTIKENLDDIKAAGYTAVQTSCIQPPKDYGQYWTDMTGQWWKFYQPIDICVADGNTWLGTKAELTDLCDTAHDKGIKIICDIVVNHMGNNDSGSGFSSQINPTLLNNSSCWHPSTTSQNGSSHYDMTQNRVTNCPDLNTANKTVQNMVIALLKEAIDCGVDGFRFDAAQNIEVPDEYDSTMGSFGSDFWPTVMNAVKAYKSDVFAYGEMYYDAWGTIDKYLSYIGHVSEPIIGCEGLLAARDKNSGKLATVDYKNNRSASNNVLWVESHDSYFYGTGTENYSGGRTNTKDISDDIITRAWAIIGSRNKATALFFARPNATMRLASSDTTWKSTAVAEVNKFKNYFRGQSEYLSSTGYVAYNERGTSGVVISKLDGAGSVSLTANKMASGTYKDQITGNTFTVSGGKITGTVGPTGVAVVYNPSNTSVTEATVVSSGKILTLNPGVWNTDSAWFAAYFFGGSSQETWVRMSGSGSTYTVDVPEGYTKVIFVRMNKNDTYTMSWDNKWNQTNDLTIPASNATYTISGWGSGTDVCPGSWTVDPTTALPTSAPTNPPTNAPTDAPTNAPTDAPTNAPTDAPTNAPTNAPTDAPTNPQTDAPTSAPASTAYYLVGSMSSWNPASSYNFATHKSDDGSEEYKLTVYLESGVKCKAVKSTDGTNINAWYPDGMNNDISITSAGWYAFYLRPNGDGHDGWITSGNDSSKKVLYYKSTTAPATEAPTVAPTPAPTDAPTDPPTLAPTDAPTSEPSETFLLGDVDGDGTIAILDATMIQMIKANYITADDRMVQRGLITDVTLNIMDATAIQRYIANYHDENEIGAVRQYR